MKQYADRLQRIALLAVFFGMLLGVILFWPHYEIKVSYQKTGEVICSVPAQTGDHLRVRLTHSFEHIPWNEYYTINEEGKFNLDRIEVAGFGAGIPAEMDVPTYVGDDGFVHMDDINSVFDRFTWITSNKNMKDLTLNDQIIVDFTQIPHHSFVQCEFILKRGYY